VGFLERSSHESSYWFGRALAVTVVTRRTRRITIHGNFILRALSTVGLPSFRQTHWRKPRPSSVSETKADHRAAGIIPAIFPLRFDPEQSARRGRRKGRLYRRSGDSPFQRTFALGLPLLLNANSRAICLCCKQDRGNPEVALSRSPHALS